MDNLTIVGEITEQQFLAALQEFTTASIETVGLESTFNTLAVITEVIKTSPETYRKIFHPKMIAKIQEMSATGTKPTMGNLMGLITDLMKILNE